MPREEERKLWWVLKEKKTLQSQNNCYSFLQSDDCCKEQPEQKLPPSVDDAKLT